MTLTPTRANRVTTLGVAMLAAAMLLGVLFWNGAPLIYFDTAGYLASGNSMLEMVGIAPPQVDAAAAGGGTAASDDGLVVGSRSAVYALLLTSLMRLLGLAAPVLVQALVLTGTIWMAVRTLAPSAGLNATATVSASLIAASLGSASFYVAFLMPDIFAATLILAMATLALRPKETPAVLTFGLWVVGVASVVMHPSHLVLAGMMAAAALVLGWVVRGPGFWRTVALLTAIPAFGTVERLAFQVSVEQVTEDRVIYLPFATARLISDGPGMAFLEDTCPDPQWASCALYPALSSQDNIAPDTILFSRSPDTASFTALSPQQRQLIAEEQTAFARAVTERYPLLIIGAALGNTIEQLGRNGVHMTVPDPAMTETILARNSRFPIALTEGHLISEDRRWLITLNSVHQVYYGVAATALLALIALPSDRIPPRLKFFALFIVIGVICNAAATGAISQPASRYGARVMFLIPLTAAFLAMIRFAPDRKALP